MNNQDTKALAEIIIGLTKHNHWRTIVASELIDQLADYLVTQTSARRCDCDGYTQHKIDCASRTPFDRDAWIAECYK